jgi:hypothetical protein
VTILRNGGDVHEELHEEEIWAPARAVHGRPTSSTRYASRKSQRVKKGMYEGLSTAPKNFERNYLFVSYRRMFTGT